MIGKCLNDLHVCTFDSLKNTLLKIVQNDYIILVYGFIRKEKCINYLINIVKNYKFSKNVKIIIAGEQANEIKL